MFNNLVNRHDFARTLRVFASGLHGFPFLYSRRAPSKTLPRLAKDVAQKYGISAMPTFYAIKNGEKVGEVIGASKDNLEALIAKHK